MTDKVDPALIASTALDAVGAGLSASANLAQGPAATGLTLAGAGVELVGLLVRAFGSQAPIEIPRMRDALKAAKDADARVAVELMAQFGLSLEVKP